MVKLLEQQVARCREVLGVIGRGARGADASSRYLLVRVANLLTGLERLLLDWTFCLIYSP